MKTETIKHPTHTVSCVSDSMAEHFKEKITKEQLEVLKHNVYTLEKEDAIHDKYHGCGCGWVELDIDGRPTDLKYLDEDVIQTYIDYDEDEEETVIFVAGYEHQNLYLTTGDSHSNSDMLEFHTDQLMPLILPNGNIRLLVNFSCYQLVRY